MLIVRLSPGLANQMYEYAAGYALAKELNQELVLEIAECVNSPFGYLLDYFHIPASRKILYSQVSIAAESHDNCDSAMEIFRDTTVLVQDGRQKERYSEDDRVLIYTGLEMAEKLSAYKNLYLCGYFFDRNRYYGKFWDEIRSFFVLKEENEDIAAFRKRIDGKVSVGVHIRRGDMLLADWAVRLEDQYYTAAAACCRALLGNDCIFCVFSDDITYAKEIMGTNSSVYYVHFSGYEDASLYEFYCLSLCNHRILSNSSTFGRLADDLNWGKQRYVFTRDIYEKTRGISLSEKALQREILLNAEDIKEYSVRYAADRTEDQPENHPGEDGLAEYHRFLRLVRKNRNHEALQQAYCIYNQWKTDTEFKIGLAQALIRIGAYEESVVELAAVSSGVVNDHFRDLILDVEKKERLMRLHGRLSGKSHRHFIIVLGERAMPSRRTYGLIDLGIILGHIGHSVTLVYDLCVDTDRHYMGRDGRQYNTREVFMECRYAEKNKVLSKGIAEFYNEMNEEELIIIARDARFLTRENCRKKLTLITTDASDIKDEEIRTMRQCSGLFENLYDKADYILTRIREMEKENGKYRHWEDRGYKGTFLFVEFPWRFGYGQRLNGRMTGMAETLLCVN